MNARKGEVPAMISAMRVAVFLLLVPTMLVGCGTYRWTEDVQLGDGRIIKINRIEKYEGGGGIGNTCHNCRLVSSEIQFDLDGNSYNWKSSPHAKAPMILDIVNGDPVVVTTPGPGSFCMRSEDNSRYYYYVYGTFDGAKWINRGVPPGSMLKERNLNYYKAKRKSHVGVPEKREWLMSPGRALYKEFSYISEDSEKHCRKVYSGGENGSH